MKVRGRFTSYRKLVPGRQNTFGVSKPRLCGFRALLATFHAKEHDGVDEHSDAAACRADAQWGRRSRNASHSPAQQRRWGPPAAHPLSGGEAGKVSQGAGQGPARRHARQGEEWPKSAPFFFSATLLDTNLSKKKHFTKDWLAKNQNPWRRRRTLPEGV